MNVEKELPKTYSEENIKKIGEELSKSLYIDEFQFDTKKQQIDAKYLHEIKRKTEMVLEKIIEKYNLTPYISEKMRYRLNEEKWYQSKYKQLFDDQKDINGNKLRYGYDFIPTTFEEWANINLPDYTVVSEIYANMCGFRRVLKDDLKTLNSIAKRYIK